MIVYLRLVFTLSDKDMGKTIKQNFAACPRVRVRWVGFAKINGDSLCSE